MPLRRSAVAKILTASAPVIGQAPAWFTAMADKTWSQPVSNDIYSQRPSPDPVGSSGNKSICGAWTGACVDQSTGEFILAANGGHVDYSGNESYGCNLKVASPAWERLNNPTANSFVDSDGSLGGLSSVGRNSIGRYADGNIRTVHGYDRCTFGNGRVWYAGLDGMYDADGQWSTAIWSFTRETKVWTYHGLGMATIGSNYQGDKGSSRYDSSTGKVWSAGVGGSNAANRSVYTIDASSLVIAEQSINLDIGMTGEWSAMCPDLGLWLIGDTTQGRIVVIQTSNVGAGVTLRTPTGGTFPGSGYGCVYHAASRALLLWHNNGADVIKISIPANPLTGGYVISTVSPAGSNAVTPGTAQTNGTFSRFNVVNDMGNGQSALVLVNGTGAPGDTPNGNTYVYKMPLGGV